MQELSHYISLEELAIKRQKCIKKKKKKTLTKGGPFGSMENRQGGPFAPVQPNDPTYSSTGRLSKHKKRKKRVKKNSVL